MIREKASFFRSGKCRERGVRLSLLFLRAMNRRVGGVIWTSPLLLRRDPIHREFAGLPHECGHYKHERVETEYDGLLSGNCRWPARFDYRSDSP